MKTATISQAKDRLSEYLQMVERGETVLILRRDKPIARIVPVSSERNNESRRLAELERLGILRRPRRKPAPGWYDRLPPAPSVPADVDLVQILIEQRGR